MQIDGIKLLRNTMREMGFPERKIRNALSYLRDENARIISKKAAEEAIACETKLQDMYGSGDSPFRKNYHNWNPDETPSDVKERIRNQWCLAQLRRLITDRRIPGAAFTDNGITLTYVQLAKDPNYVLVDSDVATKPYLLTIKNICILLSDGNKVDYDWLERWWAVDQDMYGTLQISTRPLFCKLGVLK